MSVLATPLSETKEVKNARYFARVQEEAPLVEAACQGSTEALDWAAQITLPARRKVAEYFLGPRSFFVEDATQHGWYGVLRALPKYDARHQVRFSDYCLPQIYNKIGKFRFDVPTQIRIPAWAHEARRKAAKESAGIAETVEKLAGMGMSHHVATVVATMNFAVIQEEYAEEKAIGYPYASLADTACGPAETICLNEEYHWVRYALRTLSKQEREVLSQEFGFNGNPAQRHARRRGMRRQKVYLAALAHLRNKAEEADIYSPILASPTE